jgi:hypothetical protein
MHVGVDFEENSKKGVYMCGSDYICERDWRASRTAL